MNITHDALQEKLAMIAKTMKGSITYGFTNDYMFRAVLQKNPVVLSEIVRVLLKIPKEKMVVCEIKNPIRLGKSLESKDCILDIKVCVNGEVLVNLEMQMSVTVDWIKRSMYYGFDMYTDLKSGQDYSDCRPSYHIGFVKKSPFKNDKRFYSKYLLMEEETHRVYSGDFQINMINLSQIENATEKDRKSGLYDWVRLFLVTEWEELMEMAQKSEAIGQAVVTFAELSEEEEIRLQCEARRKYEMDQSSVEKSFQKLKNQLEEQNAQLEQQAVQLKELKLYKYLAAEGRFEELQRVMSDEELKKRLIDEMTDDE